MKVKNARSKRLDILGSDQASPERRPDVTAIKLWQRNLGYFSLFAGFATIFTSQAQNVSAKDSGYVIPPRITRRASELVTKLHSACSKPDLLMLQSEYRLPHQKKSLNMISLLVGGDDCPGVPIAPGAYTSAAPFVDTGTTVGLNDTVSGTPEDCTYMGQVVGPDAIYSLKISALGANPQITISTTSPTYDMAVYILDGSTGTMCPAGTGNTITNCLQGSDVALQGDPEILPAEQMNQLPLHVPLYLFVDSFYGVPGDNGGTPSGPYTLTMQDVTVEPLLNPPANDAPVDINGDGKSDFTVIRNTGGGINGQVTWFTMFADGFPTTPTEWGIASDQFVPADFDGDGKDDFAVFRPGTTGAFYIVRSNTHTLLVEPFGTSGDDASVVGDYTGDNIDDLAVYRDGAAPGDQSFWYYRSIGSASGVKKIPWGESGDFVAPGDYDGDGKYDFVVQRPDANGVDGRFFIRTAAGTLGSDTFGLKNDTLVPGDYDGDGKTDLAVLRDDGGFLRWDFEPSGTAGKTVVTDRWGVSATDYVAQGDYDGDGKTDYAVWRPGSPGKFYVMTVGTRFITHRIWGEVNDVPVAGYNVH